MPPQESPDGPGVDPQDGADSSHVARPPLFLPSELECTVVRYRHRPDRCTIHPPEGRDVDRLATWLSADREALCPLDEWR